MHDGAEEQDGLLWLNFRREVGNVGPDELDAVLGLAHRLIVDWGSNRSDMRRVLSQGVCRGELPAEILSRWDAQWVMPTSDEALHDLGAHASAPSGLPSALRECERAIVEQSRKKGYAALEMGRHLSLAQTLCGQCGLSFEVFLTHLQCHHGINRSTCYSCLKYVTWDLPPGMGTAMMKWIVQGFERGSALANEVIHVAMAEHLTLAELKTRYGLRRIRGAAASLPASSNPDRESGPDTLATLQQKRARLLALQERISSELQQVEEQLQQLASPAPCGIKHVASCD